MDFAPYQASPPEHSRPFSPPRPSLGSPAHSPRGSYDYARRPSNIASPPPLQHPQPQRQWVSHLPGGYDASGPGAGAGAAGYAQIDSPGPSSGYAAGVGLGGYGLGAGVSEFDTSLGLRLDYEAAAAYLVFPPLGAILLLILERSSDYVR